MPERVTGCVGGRGVEAAQAMKIDFEYDATSSFLDSVAAIRK
jgi:hypothetical protein